MGTFNFLGKINKKGKQEGWLDSAVSTYLNIEEFVLSCYLMQWNLLGSDHTLVKLKLCIGKEVKRPTSFKSYVKDSNLVSKIKDKWLFLPHNIFFFGKLRYIRRLYRWFSKEKNLHSK